MKITVSQYAGFCFGVERAVNICGGLKPAGSVAANRLSAEINENVPRPLQMLGELIHNRTIVKNLEARGIKVVDSLDKIKKGTVIITAHGIYPEIYTAAKKKGLYLVDATCPRVTAVQQIARRLQAAGRRIVIIGDSKHIEVQGVNGAIGWRGKVVATAAEAEKIALPAGAKIGVVSQTTQAEQRFHDIVTVLQTKFADVESRDTICESTRGRQREAKELAQSHEVMIVIGSRTSGNTKRLYELCRSLNNQTYWIDTADDLQANWFAGVESAGITAGASTPQAVVKEVAKRIVVL